MSRVDRKERIKQEIYRRVRREKGIQKYAFAGGVIIVGVMMIVLNVNTVQSVGTGYDISFISFVEKQINENDSLWESGKDSSENIEFVEYEGL